MASNLLNDETGILIHVRPADQSRIEKDMSIPTTLAASRPGSRG